MRNCWLWLFLLFLQNSYAQNFQKDSIQRSVYVVSAGPEITIGEFAGTHPFGFGIAINWNKQGFGKNISPALNAGFHYLFGKNEIVSGQPYSYSNYSIINLSPGIQYRICKKTGAGLYTGPVMNIYQGKNEFGIGVLLTGEYLVSTKFSILPVLQWIKLTKADPIILFSLKAGFRF